MYAIHQIISAFLMKSMHFGGQDSGTDRKGIQCVAQFDSWNPISGILRMNQIS